MSGALDAFAIGVGAPWSSCGSAGCSMPPRPIESRVALQAAQTYTDTGASWAAAGGVVLGLVSGLAQRQRRRVHHPKRHQVQKCRAGAGLTRPALPPGVYCEAGETTVRRKTRTVYVGNVPIGSEHPIATQTMATTLTDDVEATVAQIKRCADLGVDIVRLTVQGMREAKACEHIQRRLREEGYTTPIVADIHFTPKVALVAAKFCDKIRVNPGNFTDGRKSFNTITELTQKDIREAQEDIEAALTPLVLSLKEQNKALRIGVNHGSLSERILFQYGDSPAGMVNSAMEFGDICRKLDFHNFVFSMKSSNPQVMVNAYRLLAREMYARGWDYPIHLGVTEAGGGADGRIKSSVGIGALVLDGLGDTIRVSLTEDPEFEAHPCIALRTVGERALGKGVAPFVEIGARRDGHQVKRKCVFPPDVPLNMDGSVLARMTTKQLEDVDVLGMCKLLGLHLRKDGDVQKDWKSVDAVVLEGPISPSLNVKLKHILDVPTGLLVQPGENIPDGATILHQAAAVTEKLVPRLGGHALIFTGEEPVGVIEKAIQFAEPRFILLRPDRQTGVTFLGRRFFSRLASLDVGKAVPVMFWFRYPHVEGEDRDDLIVRASSEFGSLFVDSLGDGLLWDAQDLSADDLRESSFNLLQASRMRVSKTEFISCPSCGRTLFNLQETVARIQERTGHLRGLRIAVMGCIVNGPGEMADADFGYVGSGVGLIDLYVNYDCVKRAIKTEDAVDQLIELIKEHGRWEEPRNLDDE